MKRSIPLIIIEGATVMAVELCGAKLMAPVFGGSLFVWAAILAITLCALALGYYIGGVLSSSEKLNNKLYQIIVAASIFIALMPFMAVYVLPYISYLNFKLAVLLSAFVLIFVPIFLLGCTTPLLIRINTHNAETAGLVSGKVYAISTIGGIVSTLLCGFILIPFLGLKFTLLAFAILLLITGVIVLKVFKINSSLILFVVVVFSAKLYAISDAALYYKNGILGEIDVVDLKEDNVRQLRINKIVQTEMALDTKLSTSIYVNMIDSLIPVQSDRPKALVLGLGGGLVANLLETKNYEVDAVEFDIRIIEAAKTYFLLHNSVETYCEDARYFINTCDKTYDLIIFDLFKAEEQPSHTITMESLNKVKKMLSKDGLIIINWHGYIKEPLGAGTQILLNTLRQSQFEVETRSSSTQEDHSNTLIIARRSELVPQLSSVTVNIDDVPILELANAKANLRWRVNYLRYYQGKK